MVPLLSPASIQRTPSITVHMSEFVTALWLWKVQLRDDAGGFVEDIGTQLLLKARSDSCCDALKLCGAFEYVGQSFGLEITLQLI